LQTVAKEEHVIIERKEKTPADKKVSSIYIFASHLLVKQTFRLHVFSPFFQ